MSETRPLFLEKSGEVARLVLNRPDKHNAISQAMWEAIPGLVQDVEKDPGIKLLVVTGSSEAAFSAGADISEFEALNTNEALRDANRRAITDGLRALHGLKKPSIAVIRGICMGGGCAIALTCDLRLASPDARFAIPPARLGLAYSLEETKHLVDVVGPAHAKSMLFTGRTVDAEEALRIGLLNEVHEAPALDERTDELAHQICANSQYSVRAIKQIIGEIAAGADRETETSWQWVVGAYGGEDYREGVRAFREKRKPRFTFS